MLQLLPEVKVALDGLSDGFTRFSTKPEMNDDCQEIRQIMQYIDNRIALLSSELVLKTPQSLREMLREGLTIKKNADRALCTYVGVLLGEGKPDNHFDHFLALELQDISILLIDDVLDGAERRATLEAHHHKWGFGGTAITASFIDAMSRNLVLQSRLQAEDIRRVLTEMEQIQLAVYEGQYIDLFYQTAPIDSISTDDYLRMVSKTTGAQFAGCFRIGAYLSHMEDGLIGRLGEIGMNFGIIGQIRDDLIDYLQDEVATWKTPMLDFRTFKKRIPLLVAWQHATQDERKEIQRLAGKQPLDGDDILHLLSLIMKPDCLAVIEQLVRQLELEARERLESFTSGLEGKRLLDILFRMIHV